MKNKRKPKHQSSNFSKEKLNLKGREKIFGLHAVANAWRNPDRVIHGLYGMDNALQTLDHMLDGFAQKGLERPTPRVADKRMMEQAFPHGTVHQGVVLDTEPLEDVFLPDIINDCAQKERSTIMILDQVTDPHNVGAIIRSASAFGAGGLIMQKRHAPALDGIVAKTACGAVEHLPVLYETNIARSIEALQEAGYFVFGLDERGEADLSAMEKHEHIAFVLGAEGEGMRRLTAEHCDVLVRLPTQGDIQSLNVSNAAAVALYARFA